MESVFVLQHLHILPTGEEDVKLLGVYRSLEGAHSAVERLRIQPGFRDHPGIALRDRQDQAPAGAGEAVQGAGSTSRFARRNQNGVTYV